MVIDLMVLGTISPKLVFPTGDPFKMYRGSLFRSPLIETTLSVVILTPDTFPLK